jgi:hypothetical protein
MEKTTIIKQNKSLLPDIQIMYLSFPVSLFAVMQRKYPYKESITVRYEREVLKITIGTKYILLLFKN